MKVSLLHMEIRSSLEANIKAAKTAVLKAAYQKPVLIALPEYFTVPNCMGDFTDAAEISKATFGLTPNEYKKFKTTANDKFLEFYEYAFKKLLSN